MNGEIMLSRWWRTDSCKQAFERAERAKRERIERVKREFAERKAKLAQDVADWKEVTP